MPTNLNTPTQHISLVNANLAQTTSIADEKQTTALTETEFGNLIVSKTIHAGTVDETKDDISKWQGCGLNEYGFYAVNNATPVYLAVGVGFSNEGWGDCVSGELRIGDNVKESGGTLLGSKWMWFHPTHGWQTKGIEQTGSTFNQSIANSIVVDGYIHTGPTYNESTGVIKGCGLNEYGIYGVGDGNVSKFLLAADNQTFSPTSVHWGDSIEDGEFRVGDNVKKSGSTLLGSHWIWFSPTYGWQTRGINHVSSNLIQSSAQSVLVNGYVHTGPIYDESSGVIKGCGLNEYGVYGVGDGNVGKFILAADDFTFSPISTHWGDSITAGEFRVGDDVKKSGNTLLGSHWVWFHPSYGWQTSGVSHSDTTLVSGSMDIMYINEYLYVNGGVKLNGIEGEIQLGISVYLDEEGITGPGFYLKSTGMHATQGTIGGFTIGTSVLSSSNFELNSSTPSLKIGTTTGYNTGKGFWAGNDGGEYKLQIGDADTGNVLLFDGDTLSVAGNITATTISANNGDIGGWNLTADRLYSGNISIESDTQQIRVSSGVNYVAITSSGLIGYSSTLGTTFNIPVDGGAPTFSGGTIKETEYQMYTSGVIKTSATPTTNGGLIINNTSLTGYTDSGTKIIQLTYKGTDQGDAYFGDYDNGNQGFFYDHSSGTCHVRGYIQDETAFETKTADFSVPNTGGRYAVDTTSNEVQMTLPASPSLGTKVQWIDIANNFGTNHLKILNNGHKIMGENVDLWCTNNYEGGALEYTGVDYGWELI